MSKFDYLGPAEKNAQRAAWAKVGVQAFTRAVDNVEWSDRCMEDRLTYIQDLIGDLLHLASEEGPVNTEELVQSAVNNFEYEASPDYQGD